MRGQRSRRSGETSGVTYWRMSASAAGSSGDEAERVWRVAERPLTAAAEAFDRAGRESYRRVPARTDTGTALRFAARMVALPSHPVPGCAGGGAHRGADGAGPG
jgi:hypothetical protein